MIDPRMHALADVLVKHAMKVKPGENVALIFRDANIPFLKTVVQHVQQAGGRPFVEISDSEVARAVQLGMTEEQARLQAEFACAKWEKMDCSVHFVGEHNDCEHADVPAATQAMYRRLYSKPVDEVMRRKKTRWVVVQWPTPEAAQKAQMSTEAFEDFFFDVCCVDYDAMGEAMKPLVALMERTDKVHIKGPGTDLTFSIKGIPVVPCDGEFNIPDGEVFTAPVRDSINGTVAFNTPSVENGFRFENITLTFANGQCVRATANNTECINAILDTDAGARFVGEFALGVNPKVKNPMCDTLFDEKIAGSFHMALGASYDEAPNGNDSAIHWDLVLIQTPEYGGGEIYFDDVLIRKDGLFVLPELQALNPRD